MKIEKNLIDSIAESNGEIDVSQKEAPKKKKKRKRIKDDRKDDGRFRYKPDYKVWDILEKCLTRQHTLEPQIEGVFDFDSIVNDRERIKRNTEKYRDWSLVDIFKDIYGVEMSEENEYADCELHGNCKIGDVIPMRVVSIGNSGTMLDSPYYKEMFTAKTNLWKYSKFHDFFPTLTLNGLVVDRNKQRTTVDILTPLALEYIEEKTKSPWKQNRVEDFEVITVKDLQLVRGGFIGDAIIPNVSEFIGHEFAVKTFVPGSQLTLNVTSKYEDWIGETIQTFITSYDSNGRGAKLVCSRKAVLRHIGHLKMMELFGLWCDNDERWQEYSTERRTGIVTGVLNSNKKCGVFVELPEDHITGMVSVPADQLTGYPADAPIDIRFVGFEEDLVYDDTSDQLIHQVPFEVVDGALKKVNVKPVFELY